MKDVNELDFEEIVGGKELTIIDFSASWCMPCRMLAPIINQVANTVTDVNFFNLDIDDSEDIAKRYRIFSVPTLLAFKEGKVLDTMVGLNSFEQVLDFVERAKTMEVPKD